LRCPMPSSTSTGWGERGPLHAETGSTSAVTAG